MDLGSDPVCGSSSITHMCYLYYTVLLVWDIRGTAVVFSPLPWTCRADGSGCAAGTIPKSPRCCIAGAGSRLSRARGPPYRRTQASSLPATTRRHIRGFIANCIPPTHPIQTPPASRRRARSPAHLSAPGADGPACRAPGRSSAKKETWTQFNNRHFNDNANEGGQRGALFPPAKSTSHSHGSSQTIREGLKKGGGGRDIHIHFNRSRIE